MLVIACVGRIASDPVVENKQRSCRLAVKLEKNQVIKLITWSKEAPLEKDAMVFVIGTLTKIEDIHLQLEATLVCPVDQLSPVAMIATGVTKYLDQRYDQNGRIYFSSQIGSYNNKTKSYTNASLTTSHPLAKYSSDKRVAVLGTANTNTFTSSKSGNEVHVINLRGREMEITERKNDTNGGSAPTTSSPDYAFDSGSKGNMNEKDFPF